MTEVGKRSYRVVWGIMKKHERLERNAIATVKQSAVWLQTEMLCFNDALFPDGIIIPKASVKIV